MRRIGQKTARIISLAVFSAVLILGPEPASAVTITLLGDVMLGRGVTMAHTGGDWGQVFSPLAQSMIHDDLTIANLESPITQAPLVRRAYDLRAPVDSLKALSSAGIDLLTLANNHTADSGERGLMDTRSALSAAYLLSVGPDPNPLYVTVRGRTLALLALDDVTQPLDIDQASTLIHLAKKRADWVFISIHWGEEYNPGISNRQREVANALSIAGADLILGHHPHVLQGTRWIKSENSDRVTFVTYSLGNAMFDQPTPPATRLSAALQIVLDSEGVRQVNAIPFIIDWRHGKAMPAGVEDAESILHRLDIAPRP